MLNSFSLLHSVNLWSQWISFRNPQAYRRDEIYRMSVCLCWFHLIVSLQLSRSDNIRQAEDEGMEKIVVDSVNGKLDVWWPARFVFRHQDKDEGDDDSRRGFHTSTEIHSRIQDHWCCV